MGQHRSKSSKAMWEAMHVGGALAPSYPQPKRFRGNFELADLFRQYLPNGNGRRLLEMGCGGSRWLPWFGRELGFEVEGVDYSPVGCARADAGLAAVGVDGRVHCEDFLSLGPPFHSRYDVVASFGVIEHFEDPASILRLFARCLLADGLILTFVPNMAGLYGSLIKRLDRELYDTHIVFDLEDLSSYHQAAGLRIVHATYTGWTDFQSIPFDSFGRAAGLVLKNLVYAWNRALLVAYGTWPTFRPQSSTFCDSMLVIAAADETTTSTAR